MSDLAIARRYALALSETAAEKNRTERVDDDVDLVRESLEGSPDLERFFRSPIVPRAKKISVVRELFGERVDRVTLDFLLLLVEKRREGMVLGILGAYRDLRDEQQGLVSVLARSAHPIGPDEKQRLIDSVSRITGSRVRLDTEVDASLMGGIVLRVGDTVYDGSVTNKLAALRERLRSGTTVAA